LTYKDFSAWLTVSPLAALLVEVRMAAARHRVQVLTISLLS
jgi:hypothetical protein